MQLENTTRKIAAALSEIQKYWDGKQAILEMYAAGFHHWRQMEWIGFYFQFLCERHLSPFVRIPGPKFNHVEFDGFLDIPWDFKAHAINSGCHQVIVNDSWAIAMGIHEFGSVVVILAMGIVDYNDELMVRSFFQRVSENR